MAILHHKSDYTQMRKECQHFIGIFLPNLDCFV